MSQNWKIVITVLITAVVVGGGCYFIGQNQMAQLATEKQNVSTPSEHKSLVEYYANRGPVNMSFHNKTLSEAGLYEVAKFKDACPANPDGPCGFDTFIVAKEPIRTGNQEFYLVAEGGAGLSYFGPFSDDLQRIVDESKHIEYVY